MALLFAAIQSAPGASAVSLIASADATSGQAFVMVNREKNLADSALGCRH
jgi:hypothetical protein